jgi:tetratricopeptide (TPR) repeat protein
MLLGSLVGAAAVLGCQELFDGDVWWHLRAGQWILANHRIPDLDPFTFTSADRPWVDLHWGFQTVLALAHRVGGIGGAIAATGLICATTMLIALTARQREWPTWIIAIVWIPSLLLMSLRFIPRPEVVSLLLISAYMSVLLRSDRDARWLWALPIVQVIWVNVHGLFVLGPMILAAYVTDGILHSLREPAASRAPNARSGRIWWWHLWLASIAVIASCFLNPYGVRGALFPLELFPKIAVAGSPYKAYIAEFSGLDQYFQMDRIAVEARNFYGRIEFLLLLLVPWSFLLPAISTTWIRSVPAGIQIGAGVSVFPLAALALVTVPCVLMTLGLPFARTSHSTIAIARSTPVFFSALGLGAALFLVRRSRSAALLALSAGIAMGGGSYWLERALFGADTAGTSPWLGTLPFDWRWLTVVAGAACLVLTLKSGGRLYRILLSAAFSYLALQAVRNANLFALMAGFVLAANLGEWWAELRPEHSSASMSRGRSLVTRMLLIAVIVPGTIYIATTASFPARGGAIRVGLREKPLTFAHEAAIFASKPGMPERALVYDMTQASVYLFHNGPGRKLFMDPRLEVPSRATFDNYVRLEKLLNRGEAGWAHFLDDMGRPLVMLDHVKHSGAAGTLLADHRWRCVRFDPLVSVFLPVSRSDLVAPYPTIDFAARHFQGVSQRKEPNASEAAILEASGLYGVGWTLLSKPEFTWSQRIPLLLLASDRARDGIAASPENALAWLALGNALWNQALDLSVRPLGPADPWDAARGLTEAQATFAYRRAVDLDPEGTGAFATLERAFEFRGMLDARDALVARSGRTHGKARADGVHLNRGLAVAPSPWRTESELSELVDDSLRGGRPEAVAALARDAEARHVDLSWNVADRIALTQLHLGEPAVAQQLWKAATDAQSDALRLARIAEADLVLMDFEAAIRSWRAAVRMDRRLGEAWYGLALLYLQRGNAGETDNCCREGLRCSLTGPQRRALQQMRAFVARFVRH